MSRCVAQAHCIVPLSKVLHLRNTPPISPFLSLLNPEHLSSKPVISVSGSLNLFEHLWISLTPLSLFDVIDAIEPHWCCWSHWTLWIDRTPENLISDSQGSVRSVPKYSNWSHTDVLGTWMSMCSDRCLPQRPPVYIFNSIWCFGQCVNQKWCHLMINCAVQCATPGASTTYSDGHITAHEA